MSILRPAIEAGGLAKEMELGDDGAFGEEVGVDVDAEAGAGGDFDDAVGVGCLS